MQIINFALLMLAIGTAAASFAALVVIAESIHQGIRHYKAVRKALRQLARED